ncbi:MAG TPA: DUF378 domain-containing protein [Burkholderiales bacterium]|nr:DUF378 domain-containing protein [Burkholderiales bacterium]
MKKIISIIVLLLSAIGAINWGLVGAFNIDLVAMLFGAMSSMARIIYILVGIAGVILLVGGLKCMSMMNCDNNQCSPKEPM